MHVHLDLVGGLAGDMFLAAAIDAGLVDLGALTADLRTLGLGDAVEILTERAIRGAIEGTHVRFSGWDPSADADHRHLTEIERMLEQSGLSERVRARATAMFRTLGAAEARIHGIELERVHFHEVGAVDSILDFVSAAWILEHTRATWSFGSVPTGRGSISTAHGTIPVPAPATAALLEGFELQPTDVPAELVTPTGAAILKSLDRVDFAGGTLSKSGFGCGTRDLDGVSNVVRMMVFDTARPKYETDEVAIVEADIDDMTAEDLAWVANAALPKAGALDVTRTHLVMKKGRTGVRLAVLCPPQMLDSILDVVFEQTSTLGVRVTHTRRYKLSRRIEEVSTQYGVVRVKLGLRGEEVLNVAAEHDDCVALAERAGVSPEEVRRAASSRWLDERENRP